VAKPESTTYSVAALMLVAAQALDVLSTTVALRAPDTQARELNPLIAHVLGAYGAAGPLAVKPLGGGLVLSNAVQAYLFAL
jgi:hypothetical protein